MDGYCESCRLVGKQTHDMMLPIACGLCPHQRDSVRGERSAACKPHGGEAVAALSGGMQANTWNVGKQAGQLRWRIIDELLLFLSCRKAGVCMASVCSCHCSSIHGVQASN